MGKIKDITGLRFGRLIAVKVDQKATGRLRWLCNCDCGAIKSVESQSLVTGKTKSCGCIFGAGGMSRTAQYNAWRALKRRCQNPNDHRYSKYGGRGITLCERWQRFENFFADMGPRPPGTSIDRIDNNGNYEPGNCRWATNKEQSNNRSSNKIIIAFNLARNFKQWAELLGLTKTAISKAYRREDFEMYIIKKKGIRYVYNQFFSRRARAKATTA